MLTFQRGILLTVSILAYKQVLADERMKESALIDNKEVRDVWHRDDSKRTKSRKAAKRSQTPASRPSTSHTAQLQVVEIADTGGDGADDGGGGGLEWQPYTGPRAGQMEKIRQAFLKVCTPSMVQLCVR